MQKQSPEVFLKFSQNSQENTCAGVSFLKKFLAGNEFCAVIWNTFFTTHPWTTTSVHTRYNKSKVRVSPKDLLRQLTAEPKII